MYIPLFGDGLGSKDLVAQLVLLPTLHPDEDHHLILVDADHDVEDGDIHPIVADDGEDKENYNNNLDLNDIMGMMIMMMMRRVK